MAGSANIRVGSAERESALHALAEHLTADRIDVAEYEQRCGAVASARTRADLLTVFDDLPIPHPRWDPEEQPPQALAPAPVEKSPLFDDSPARLSRPIVLTLGGIMIVLAVVVAAVTTTWWALIPALLVIIVMFLTN
jgi:hypothetical protein